MNNAISNFNNISDLMKFLYGLNLYAYFIIAGAMVFLTIIILVLVRIFIFDDDFGDEKREGVYFILFVILFAISFQIAKNYYEHKLDAISDYSQELVTSLSEEEIEFSIIDSSNDTLCFTYQNISYELTLLGGIEDYAYFDDNLQSWVSNELLDE